MSFLLEMKGFTQNPDFVNLKSFRRICCTVMLPLIRHIPELLNLCLLNLGFHSISLQFEMDINRYLSIFLLHLLSMRWRILLIQFECSIIMQKSKSFCALPNAGFYCCATIY